MSHRQGSVTSALTHWWHISAENSQATVRSISSHRFTHPVATKGCLPQLLGCLVSNLRPQRAFETSTAYLPRTQQGRSNSVSAAQCNRKAIALGHLKVRPFARSDLAHADCGCGQATLEQATARNVNRRQQYWLLLSRAH